MKSIFFLLCGLCVGTFSTAQSARSFRYGSYIDFYRFGVPALEVGGLLTHSLSAKARVKMEGGVLISESTQTLFVQSQNYVYGRNRAFMAAVVTVAPSFFIGKRFAPECNFSALTGPALANGKKVGFLIAPGFALRYPGIEIRARYQFPSKGIGIGLSLFWRDLLRKQGRQATHLAAIR
jgi:hypothetical protein